MQIDPLSEIKRRILTQWINDNHARRCTPNRKHAEAIRRFPIMVSAEWYQMGNGPLIAAAHPKSLDGLEPMAQWANRQGLALSVHDPVWSWQDPGEAYLVTIEFAHNRESNKTLDPNPIQG